MIKRALTYLMILAITALPVQLISANAENVSMQMSMSQQLLSNNECLHEMTEMTISSNAEKNSVSAACCDDSTSNCEGCNDVAHATTTMASSAIALIQTSLLRNVKLFANNSLSHGIPQKNLLRPPRTTI